MYERWGRRVRGPGERGRRRRRRPSAARGLAALFLAWLLAAVAACGGGSGGGEPDAAETPAGDTPAADALERVWAVPVSTQGRVVWSGPEVLVVRQDADLHGYAAADGEELWRLAPPEGATGPCAVSPGLTADGVGGVAYRVDHPEDGEPSCSVLAAVRAETGELLWTEDHTGASALRSEEAAVSASENVLTMGLFCGTVHRHHAVEGTALPGPDAPGERCNDAVHSAGHLVVRYSAADGDTLTAYHADTYDELWSRPAAEDEARLRSVLADEPLTLSVDGGPQGGHRVQTFGADGEPERWIGEEALRHGGLEGTAAPGAGPLLDGERLLLSARKGELHLLHDLRGGEELWRGERGAYDSILGFRDGALLAVADAERDPDRPLPAGLVLLHRELHPDAESGEGAESGEDGAAGGWQRMGLAEPLASGPEDDEVLIALVGWDDQHLYVAHRELSDGYHLAAYRLPDGAAGGAAAGAED